MQCPDKILCQWHSLHRSLFRHHSQAYVARGHLLHVTHVCLPNHLAEK